MEKCLIFSSDENVTRRMIWSDKTFFDKTFPMKAIHAIENQQLPLSLGNTEHTPFPWKR